MNMEWLKIPTWLISLSLFVIVVAFAVIMIIKPSRFEFAGLGFGFEKEKIVQDSIPTGAIVAFSPEIGKDCPLGWITFKDKHVNILNLEHSGNLTTKNYLKSNDSYPTNDKNKFSHTSNSKYNEAKKVTSTKDRSVYNEYKLPPPTNKYLDSLDNESFLLIFCQKN